jgi:hypothetical protein
VSADLELSDCSDIRRIGVATVIFGKKDVLDLAKQSVEFGSKDRKGVPSRFQPKKARNHFFELLRRCATNSQWKRIIETTTRPT